MKLTFLGTAAAEGIPSAFCDCPTCDHARKHLGKNVRKRQAVLVNDDLLIDNGPDVYAACGMYGISLVQVKYNLITHSHSDHFLGSNLAMRTRSFRRQSTIVPMQLTAPPSVFKLFGQGNDEALDLTRMTIVPNQSFELPPYRIKSLTASHHEASGDAMNFIIDDGSKKLLFASDTGMYKEQVWDEMAGHSFDLIIIESTTTDTEHQKVHLNYSGVHTMLEKMEQIGAKRPDTTVYVSHFSHQHNPSHDELVELYGRTGIHVAYDGMVLEL